MRIITLPHFAMERDEDGTANAEFQRLVTYAMRWWPEGLNMSDIDFAKGAAAIRSLAQGDTISYDRMQLAVGYVIDSIAFYESNPWEGSEPYEGRNAAAIADLRALLDVVNVEVLA